MTLSKCCGGLSNRSSCSKDVFILLLESFNQVLLCEVELVIFGQFVVLCEQLFLSLASPVVLLQFIDAASCLNLKQVFYLTQAPPSAGLLSSNRSLVFAH